MAQMRPTRNRTPNTVERAMIRVLRLLCFDFVPEVPVDVDADELEVPVDELDVSVDELDVFVEELDVSVECDVCEDFAIDGEAVAVDADEPDVSMAAVEVDAPVETETPDDVEEDVDKVTTEGLFVRIPEVVTFVL
jgi:hypothetical protein